MFIAMEKNMFLWIVMRAQWREGKEKNMRRDNRRVLNEIDSPVTVTLLIVEWKVTST